MEQDDTLISLATESTEPLTSASDNVLRQFFSEDNFEKLEALSEAYGIPIEGVLNVAVSDQFDSKIASMRDAAG